MSVHDGLKIIPKANNTSLESEPKHHTSYDRIHESWRLSRDEGTCSLQDFVSSPQEPLHISCDRLVEVLGDAQHDSSDFGAWAFKQGAAILSEIEPDSSYIDNNDFTHTAKYLFVGACFSSGARSVLDDAQSRPVAERLLDRAIAFCEQSQSLGTMPLVIKGIMASNIRAWAESGDLKTFVGKPKSFTSAGFQKLIHHASEVEVEKLAAVSRPITGSMSMIERFTGASSPTEFLLWAFSRNVPLPIPEALPQLRRALSASLGDQAQNYPFLAQKAELTARPGEASGFHVPLELRQGIYVDVFGTLIHHDGSPNLRLAQVITDLMREDPSRRVFLVSDSQDEEIERALAFLNPLPSIVHKDNLEGCEIEYLIDNSEPGPQGLHARNYLPPERAGDLGALLKKSDTR